MKFEAMFDNPTTGMVEYRTLAYEGDSIRAAAKEAVALAEAEGLIHRGTYEIEIATEPVVTFPKTVAQFRRQAESAFRAANADAADATIEWTFGPKRVTFPTGVTGFSGVFKASASGFRSRSCVASATPEFGIAVR